MHRTKHTNRNQWHRGRGGGLIGASLLGLLVIGIPSPGGNSLLRAQSSNDPARLTLRRSMATGTQTVRAGRQLIDSVSGGTLYVPPQAVGTRRVPLVVVLHGGGIDPRTIIRTQSSLADTYGMILFAPELSGPVISDEMIQTFDTSMRYIFQHFAIDPDKVAITGMSNGGYATLVVGCANPDIFSRIAPLSPVPPRYPNPCGGNRTSPKPQFFVSAGIGEPTRSTAGFASGARMLQQAGYMVLPALDLRGHANRPEDNDRVWHWLQESWQLEGATDSLRPAPLLAPKLLTPSALAAMTTFWSSLTLDPDSLDAHRAPVRIPMGDITVTVFDMTDLAALAKTNPSVTTALTAAGLTLQREASYRAALVSARAMQLADSGTGTHRSPTLTKNLAFVKAHQTQVNELENHINIPRCENSAQAQFGC